MVMMTWMAYTGLILLSNGTFRISDFAMADPGLMKFVMALTGLPLLATPVLRICAIGE
jgi:hypothetical protein